MKVNVARLLKALVAFIAIDMLYLGVLKRDSIQSYFKNINCGRAISVRVPAALVSWFFLALGLELFVFPYANSKKDAMMRGALVGLVIYGVYDATNFASLDRWTLKFSIMDTLWGTILSAAVAGVVF